MVEQEKRRLDFMLLAGAPWEEPLTISDLGKLIQVKRKEILALAAKHGANNVRVFGSAARGETGPASEVDFLVSVGPERTPFSRAVW